MEHAREHSLDTIIARLPVVCVCGARGFVAMERFASRKKAGSRNNPGRPPRCSAVTLLRSPRMEQEMICLSCPSSDVRNARALQR